MSQPFLDAVRAGDQPAAERMLVDDPALADARDGRGTTAVLLALYHGHSVLARSLAARRADLDIFEAAALGALEQARDLVDANPALAGAYAEDGFYPLGLAAFFGQPAMVELLLARGAPVGAVSRNGMQVMPLHAAVAARDLESARLLLAHGADARATQADGFTPLHGAAQNGQLELVELLLDHGADPAARTAGGQTPLDLAQAQGHGEVERRLRNT
ncbi:MAG TPA: ankyrin repeat domain-containing protein [Roseiflexaceae bacterium]|nr:ankyrin repeat domain-containing protein [Roseiflexaceae bacterium]